MKLVDTTVAVDHLRGVAQATECLDQAVSAHDIVAGSEILRFEVLAGMRIDEAERTEDFFGMLAWVEVTEAVARRAAALAQAFRASHSGIDDADYLIAATAMELGAQLLTTNVRHFPMLSGLEPAY